MVRDIAKKQHSESNPEFRFRGETSSRLENFSDAVFALAVTLLLIATTPPANFEQIKRFIWDVIPFSICIALIILVWYQHFIFFFRYGLKSTTIVALNTVFLVIVLFYVYPLKFLTQLSLFPLAYLFDQNELLKELKSMISPGDMGYLMVIYGLGAMSVFYMLAIMYKHALGQADNLELTEIEKFETSVSIKSNLLMGTIPLISVILALILINSPYAGLVSGVFYFMYAPVMFLFGHWVDKKRNKLFGSGN